VSFFEPPPPPPEPPEIETRAWWQSPRNELGVSTGLRLVLARTDDVAVAVVDAVAFTTGVALRLVSARRQPGHDDPFELQHHFMHRVRPGTDLPPELLRFGVEFSDGRKATSLGSGPWASFSLGGDEEPEGPLLLPEGGGGSDDRWEQEFWLWPLPAPGPLAFVVEWPAEGIELTRQEVDSAPILEAAGRSEALWREPG
jgi:hypothetical protein